MVFQTFGLGFILAAIYCARHMVLASGGHLVRGHAAHNRRRRGTAALPGLGPIVPEPQAGSPQMRMIPIRLLLLIQARNPLISLRFSEMRSLRQSAKVKC